MSESTQLPKVEREGDLLVISIGVDALIDITSTQPAWPTTEDGEPCKVIDREQYLADLIIELQREEEDGTTPLHRVFDEAALEMLENGTSSVDFDD